MRLAGAAAAMSQGIGKLKRKEEFDWSVSPGLAGVSWVELEEQGITWCGWGSIIGCWLGVMGNRDGVVCKLVSLTRFEPHVNIKMRDIRHYKPPQANGKPHIYIVLSYLRLSDQHS